VPFAVESALVALVVFAGMLGLFEAGRWVRRWRAARDGDHDGGAFNVIDGGVFALLGLLIAFTFSGAAARFEARRQLIVEEANAIGTAYLRIDLVPAATQPALRQQFRDYLDARLAAFRALPDLDEAYRQVALANAVQPQIWAGAVAASREDNAARMLFLPALNQMFDIANTRTVAATFHPPSAIFVLLVLLCLACAAIAGYGAGTTRSWLHAISFAAILAGTVYVTWNLEYPRLGFIRIDPVDRVLVELRNSFK